MKFNKNTAFIVFRFLAEFANCCLNLLLLPFMIVYLGAEGFGVNAQIMAINSFLTPIAMMGLGFAVVRVIAGKKDTPRTSKYFQTTIFLVFIVSCILAVCVIIAAPVLNFLFIKISWATQVLQWGALLIILTAVELTLIEFYISRLRIVSYSIIQIIQAIIIAGGTITILIQQGALLDVILFNIVIKFFSVAALFTYFVYNEVNAHDRWMSRPEIREMIGFGLPIVIMGISMWGILLGNRIVIGFFMNIGDVGKYSAAFTIACILVVLAAPFWASLYPMMAAAYSNKDRDQFTRLCRKYMDLYLLIGIPALFGLTIIAPVLLQILGTSEFAVNSLIFGIIAIGLFSDQFTANAHYIVYIHNEPLFLRNVTIICGIINIVFCIILVPLFGIIGAGLATLVSYILLDLLLFRRVFQYGYSLDEIYDIPTIGKYILSSGIMGIILYLFFNPNDYTILNLMWAIIFGVILYSTVLWALSGFRIQNILQKDGELFN
jgi:O-antigen/teichoic acid export membrane protein